MRMQVLDRWNPTTTTVLDNAQDSRLRFGTSGIANTHRPSIRWQRHDVLVLLAVVDVRQDIALVHTRREDRRVR